MALRTSGSESAFDIRDELDDVETDFDATLPPNAALLAAVEAPQLDPYPDDDEGLDRAQAHRSTRRQRLADRAAARPVVSAGVSAVLRRWWAAGALGVAALVTTLVVLGSRTTASRPSHPPQAAATRSPAPSRPRRSSRPSVPAAARRAARPARRATATVRRPHRARAHRSQSAQPVRHGTRRRRDDQGPKTSTSSGVPVLVAAAPVAAPPAPLTSPAASGYQQEFGARSGYDTEFGLDG